MALWFKRQPVCLRMNHCTQSDLSERWPFLLHPVTNRQLNRHTRTGGGPNCSSSNASAAGWVDVLHHGTRLPHQFLPLTPRIGASVQMGRRGCRGCTVYNLTGGHGPGIVMEVGAAGTIVPHSHSTRTLSLNPPFIPWHVHASTFAWHFNRTASGNSGIRLPIYPSTHLCSHPDHRQALLSPSPQLCGPFGSYLGPAPRLQYDCDFCVHGDDITTSADGKDTCVTAAGMPTSPPSPPPPPDCTKHAGAAPPPPAAAPTPARPAPL